jgi:hypothetical protein
VARFAARGMRLADVFPLAANVPDPDRCMTEFEDYCPVARPVPAWNRTECIATCDWFTADSLYSMPLADATNYDNFLIPRNRSLVVVGVNHPLINKASFLNFLVTGIRNPERPGHTPNFSSNHLAGSGAWRARACHGCCVACGAWGGGKEGVLAERFRQSVDGPPIRPSAFPPSPSPTHSPQQPPTNTHTHTHRKLTIRPTTKNQNQTGQYYLGAETAEANVLFAQELARDCGGRLFCETVTKESIDYDEYVRVFCVSVRVFSVSLLGCL